MSYYNSPGLHVQHMGASHGITVSIRGVGSSALLQMVGATGPPQETRMGVPRHSPFFLLPLTPTHLKNCRDSLIVIYQILVLTLKSILEAKFQLHSL